ncbi:hypothetical protein TNCV_169011 [Trichonephila clavipes]|nr:hypothetical protein TNCV_169011 [Trichonephila clavipes]
MTRRVEKADARYTCRSSKSSYGMVCHWSMRISHKRLTIWKTIRRVIADIRPQMLEKVIENWTSRLDYIRASRGSHMPEIIFKM